ncbi:MAG: hypothetical protein J2P17_30990, partial [Mycobacterium sp.]|nr:hypothetical protein [Mycobacterium sp.]
MDSDGGSASRWSGDPLAIAVGNASLLGLGYWLLRRRLLAIAAVLMTALLIAILGAGLITSTWFELVVVGWWAALVG